jgi:hypothetical protein
MLKMCSPENLSPQRFQGLPASCETAKLQQQLWAAPA